MKPHNFVAVDAQWRLLGIERLRWRWYKQGPWDATKQKYKEGCWHIVKLEKHPLVIAGKGQWLLSAPVADPKRRGQLLQQPGFVLTDFMEWIGFKRAPAVWATSSTAEIYDFQAQAIWWLSIKKVKDKYLLPEEVT